MEYSKLRKQIVLEKSVRDNPERQRQAYGMFWAQRLKRVFKIEIEKPLPTHLR